MFHKVLIANRGEIALRIIRTCRELGIRSVLAHSKADAHSLPMRLADETICVGPDSARESYLNIPAIISAAAVTDSEAIHPGYGFLAENPAFAEVCRACSITFIGPSPEAIRLMGDKAQARQIAMQAGVPVIPGSEVALKGSAEAVEVADRIGYPIMFKAAAGGGGRGMRIVRERRGGFLDELLVAPLDRAVAFAEVDTDAVAIAQHLDLDVPRVLDVLLAVNLR